MNRDRFNEKIVEVSKTIFTYCMAKTPTREEAEDLSQDIICELIKSKDSLRCDDAFYGFMWSVADNVYKQWYRKKLKSATGELTAEIAETLEDVTDDGGDDIYLLRRELSLLDAKYRRATILYYIDRKSCSEIAESLSISESMVKYLLFKSRKILKEGMNMERKLGTLSYAPKSMIPMYSGEGPNRFWDFMQSKIRQNILGACYNDSLTPQMISLETGIPLPYLDDEIQALTDKKLLTREGSHYKTNIIIITIDCAREMSRAALPYHEKIAELINTYINDNLIRFKEIGFIGNDFSSNSLRWALSTLIWRTVLFGGKSHNERTVPVTGWGERAYIYCVEDVAKYTFAYSGMDGRHGDNLYFFDYLPKPNGDHRDFFGRERDINIICDIARGDVGRFSEYDLEAVAQMIRLGYVIKNENGYAPTCLVYTSAQYEKAVAIAKNFVTAELTDTIAEINSEAERVLSEHTPKHLQDQVADIAGMDKFLNAVCAPAAIMIERGYLSLDWHPSEMPTNYIVLNK